MKPISCQKVTGDTERLLCPGALQGPARVQYEGAAAFIEKMLEEDIERM